MRYQIEIANKELYDKGNYEFAMSKMTGDIDRAHKGYSNTKRDYGSALYVRLVDLEKDVVLAKNYK
jgi:hypothetical protein